jgi:hypothetical protein
MLIMRDREKNVLTAGNIFYNNYSWCLPINLGKVDLPSHAGHPNSDMVARALKTRANLGLRPLGPRP